MRSIPFNKMTAAKRVVVTRIEPQEKGWFRRLFGMDKKRLMVTRVLKDRHTGNHCILWSGPIPEYLRAFENLEIISYTIEYPPGHGGCSECSFDSGSLV